MDTSKIMMFPEMGTNNSIDPNLLLALNNNGGFGGNNWIWILFLWLIWGANGWGGNGFGNNNGGAGFLSNQICLFYKIDERGEEAAYLIGHLVRKMYKMVARVLKSYVRFIGL